MFDLSGILASLTAMFQDFLGTSLVAWFTDLVSNWLPVA